MLNFLRENMQKLKKSRYGGGGGLEIFKNFAVSAAARLHLFLIGSGSEIFKIFVVSAAATAAQPIGLNL
jgi:hypothetical protein